MSAKKIPPASAPHRLIVEGPDDLHCVVHLMERHGVDWNGANNRIPHINCAGGISEVIKAIPASLKTHQRFGVLIDRDSEEHKDLEELRSVLLHNGIPLPNPLPVEGFITTLSLSGLPVTRFGLWVMPDNQGHGALETFLEELVPKTSSFWTYAGEATTTARDKNGAPVVDFTKARFRTWLSWQEQAGVPPGEAIKRGYLEKDSDNAKRFATWIQSLFLAD